MGSEKEEMRNGQHSTKKKGLSLALITVFLISSLTVMTQLAAAADGTPSDTYNVNWQKETPDYSDNWTWTNIEWIYGPQITLNVTYANGTSLINPTGGMPSHYLVPGEQFCVNITVPKSLVELGRNVSQISFNLNKYQSYYLPNGTSFGGWSANIYLSYTAYGVSYGGGEAWKPIDPWNFQSSIYNYTYTVGGGGGGGGEPYTQPPAIFVPNRAACKFTETAEYYNVFFQGELNSSTSIKGNFWYNYWVQDTKGSSINTRNQCGSIIVIEPDTESSYGYGYASYAVDVRDMTNKAIGEVAPGSEFKIVVDITGSEATLAKNVTISLPPPADWNWWYNDTKNTQDLERYKYVYTDDDWFHNYTTGEWQPASENWFYNYTISDYQLGKIEHYADRKVLLICDVAAKTCTIQEGYEYGLYAQPGYDNWTQRFEVTSSDSSNFYNLYWNSANVTTSGGHVKIDFGVDIKPTANASAGQYYFEVRAFKTDETKIYGWGNQNFKILGDNVVKMKLMKATGDKPILKIMPGESFRAVMEVTGKELFNDTVAEHTTNITFRFTSPGNYQWNTTGDWDYSNSSYLEFYITRNTISDTTIVEVFNYSSNSQWNRVTYESFYDWSEVKVDETQYVQLGEPGFDMDWSETDNLLTLTFNVTFKSGVPEGYYSWEGYIMNRTEAGYWSEHYYEWSSDESLKYTKVRIPDTWSILVGSAESYWYYWGTPQAWGVDSKSGALDLDNNNVTTNDQFYVKRVYNSTSYWTQSGDRMSVNLNWGQYNMWSYFALMNYSWRYEWEEYYIWYYPGNRSNVQADTLALVNSTIWDKEDNTVVPEYCQISYLTLNRTWAKIQAEYAKYGWWDPEYSWTWLEINFDQNFWTPTQQGPYSYEGSSSNIFFQYAGLLVFNDTNSDGVLNMGFSGGSAEAQELTHYFVFENADGIGLTTPFPGDSGSQQVSVNDEVSWGVSVDSMNGTTYPTQVAGHSGFAGLGWWWHDCYGAYIPTGNFSSVPSKVGIGNLNFTAHFSIPNANLTAGAVNEVRVKIDEGVGAWTLYDQPQSELQSYSMAIAFLASSQNWQYSFKTSEGDDVSSDDDSATSDAYNITSNGVKMADIQMGGAEYTWGKDGQNYTMHSSTTPMSAFSAMYSSYSMSGSGSASICSFSTTGTNYFVTSSFKNWDGYDVVTDPYFAVYTSQPASGGGDGGGFGGNLLPILIVSVAGLLVLVVAVVVIKRRRQP